MNNSRTTHALLFAALVGASPLAFAHNWYVKAGAAAGIGTERSPFNSLLSAQTASNENDTIYILAAPAGTPALEGGIVLKDHQKLIGEGADVTTLAADTTTARARITNSLGDAVTLANHNDVINVHIDNPLGSGVIGVDKTKGTLKQLLLTRSTLRAPQRIDQALCRLVTDATQQEIDYASSRLVGCSGLFRPSPLISPTGRKSAILLLSELNDGDYILKDIVVNDLASFPASPVAQVLVWSAGLTVRAAGKSLLKVNVDDMTSSRSLRGVMAESFYEGHLELVMEHISVQSPINDGIGVFVEFFCAGLPPSFDLGGFTCQQSNGFPIPAGNSDSYVELDGYRFVGMEHPGTSNNSNSMGVEIGASGGVGTSRVEFHMQNSTITNAALGGVDIEQPLGSLAADSIIDLGCVSSDCKKRGYSSHGNNNIYNNGANGLAAFLGGIAARQAVLGNMQIQMLVNGSVNNANNNFIYAQNNYWGANPVAPDNCYTLDFDQNRVGPLSPTANCLLLSSGPHGTPTYFDARFPLLTPAGQSKK